MEFVLQHTRLGFCWLDLIALVVLIAVVCVFVWQSRKLKKTEEELQKKLSARYVEEVNVETDMV